VGARPVVRSRRRGLPVSVRPVFRTTEDPADATQPRSRGKGQRVNTPVGETMTAALAVPVFMSGACRWRHGMCPARLARSVPVPRPRRWCEDPTPPGTRAPPRPAGYGRPMTDTPPQPRPRHWYGTGHGDSQPDPDTPGIRLVGGRLDGSRIVPIDDSDPPSGQREDGLGVAFAFCALALMEPARLLTPVNADQCGGVEHALAAAVVAPGAGQSADRGPVEPVSEQDGKCARGPTTTPSAGSVPLPCPRPHHGHPAAVRVRRHREHPARPRPPPRPPPRPLHRTKPHTRRASDDRGSRQPWPAIDFAPSARPAPEPPTRPLAAATAARAGHPAGGPRGPPPFPLGRGPGGGAVSYFPDTQVP